MSRFSAVSLRAERNETKQHFYSHRAQRLQKLLKKEINYQMYRTFL